MLDGLQVVNDMNVAQRVVQVYGKVFDAEPSSLVRAPGRVNLIGEHTDYNDGFVLPMAIDRAVWIALRPRDDQLVRVHSLNFEETVEFSLDDFQKGKGWLEYIKGVTNALQVEGFKLKGWEGVLGGDVPKGAGLSSSAALELVAARAFVIVSDLNWEPTRMASLSQKAENQWVGVNSGIMDQMVSAAAKKGHALFLDCRSLEYEHIPLPEGIAVVVMDTSTRRGLVNSAYNERRAQCEEAARFFGVPALRDMDLEGFYRKSDKLDDTVMRRARHVITENQRVLDAIYAMLLGDVSAVGKLLYESHASLRDDFEVTNETLNQIVEAAVAHPACYGARMTGAGFGGCAVALVEAERVDDFSDCVMDAYLRRSGLHARFYVCRASEGASKAQFSFDDSGLTILD
jgi:galactokinase